MSLPVKVKLTDAEINRFCDTAIQRLSSINAISADVASFVNKYREHMLTSSQSVTPPMAGYSHIIDFMNEDVPLCWDIPKLMASTAKGQRELLSTHQVTSLIDTRFFDDPFGRSYSEGPILLAEIPMCIPQYCVIDGNHRAIQAFKSGDPMIPAIVYPHQSHMEYMSPYSKLLFTICLNIVAFSIYVEGKISDTDFEEMLLPL